LTFIEYLLGIDKQYSAEAKIQKSAHWIKRKKYLQERYSQGIEAERRG